MDAGADICVTSIHKVGSGLEQGSVFHLQGDLVPPELLGMRADLLGTTSPSVLIYAGLDGWRRQMSLRGEELMGGALDLAAEVRSAIEEIGGMHVDDRADFCGPGLSDDFDPLPGVIDLSGLGITGFQAADWLREHRHVDAHLVDHRRIGMQITHGDDRDTTGELLEALADLAPAARDLPRAPRVEVPSPAGLRMEQALLPRDAFFGPARAVPVAEAAGRIAAEMITPYPPGIPAVLPGERLTEPVPAYLRSGLDAGMHLPDPTDPTLETVRVLDEGARQPGK
jgi:lysine decarboxylase